MQEETTFPLMPNFNFRDQRGTLYTFTNPVLLRFLSDLWMRSGGPDNLISRLYAEKADAEQVSLLQSKVTDLESQIAALQIQLLNMVQQKSDEYFNWAPLLMENSKAPDDLINAVIAGVY